MGFSVPESYSHGLVSRIADLLDRSRAHCGQEPMGGFKTAVCGHQTGLGISKGACNKCVIVGPWNLCGHTLHG